MNMTLSEAINVSIIVLNNTRQDLNNQMNAIVLVTQLHDIEAYEKGEHGHEHDLMAANHRIVCAALTTMCAARGSLAISKELDLS